MGAGGYNPNERMKIEKPRCRPAPLGSGKNIGVVRPVSHFSACRKMGNWAYHAYVFAGPKRGWPTPWFFNFHTFVRVITACSHYKVPL